MALPVLFTILHAALELSLMRMGCSSIPLAMAKHAANLVIVSARKAEGLNTMLACSAIDLSLSLSSPSTGISMATEQHPHFLLIPYSEQGHIIPMLSLASHLLRLRCHVTFVKADRHPPPTPTSEDGPASAQSLHAPPSAADAAVHHEGLRFVTLPVRNKALCVDVKTMTRHQIFKNTLAGLEDRQDLVAAIIEDSKVSSYPITCIICDFILWK